MAEESINDYYIVEKLDENDYSFNFKAIEKKTGNFFCLIAFKEIDLLEMKYFRRELNIYNRLEHPSMYKVKRYNIASILPKIQNSHKTKICSGFVIYNYLPNGDAETATNEYIESNGAKCQKMNPTIRSKIIFGVASFMKYLHFNNIINRELNLSHVFIDDNFEPKIKLNFESNFFYSYQHNKNSKIDILYLSPEIIEESCYSKSSDVYSFGVLIYRMFSPYYQPQLPYFLAMIDTVKGKRPKKPDLMPQCYWKLVCRCWCQKADDRPSFSEIVEELKNDDFAIEEFGMKTNIDELHEYQNRMFQ